MKRRRSNIPRSKLLTYSTVKSILENVTRNNSEYSSSSNESGSGFSSSSTISRGSSARSSRSSSPSSNTKLRICVRGQDAIVVHFVVLSTTKLSKVFNAYAKKVGASVQYLRFLIDGERLVPSDTLAEKKIYVWFYKTIPSRN